MVCRYSKYRSCAEEIKNRAVIADIVMQLYKNKAKDYGTQLGILSTSNLKIFPSTDFLFWAKLCGSSLDDPIVIELYKYPSTGPKRI